MSEFNEDDRSHAEAAEEEIAAKCELPVNNVVSSPESLIGKSYTITENGIEIIGTVKKYIKETNTWMVKWSDGEYTPETSFKGVTFNSY